MNNAVTAFKSLGPSEYVVTPFKAYAPFSYTYTSGSTTNSEDIQVTYAIKYPSSNTLRTQSNSQYELFDSVVQTFYSSIPYSAYGGNAASYNPSSSTSVYVISLTQDVYGEEIRPGSFNVSIGANTTSDDTKGNLIFSQSGTGYVIGRVFYDKGIALLKTKTGAGGIGTTGTSIQSGTSVNVSFSSSIKLYEHSVQVKLSPNDFNFSVYNPTSTKTFYTGSSITPLQSMVSRSMNPLSDGYLRPYISTIGLYNANDEMVAVAKLSNPIQRAFDSKQTFVVKFDT